MIEVREGNVLDIQKGIIAHQVNCQGVMGSGIALQIKRMYPSVFTRYAELCKRFQWGKDLLGDVCTLQTDENPNLYIANIFGQHNYGVSNRHTSYDATYDAWNKVFASSRISGLPIYMPYGMGCGLGGGNWDIYSAIVNSFNEPVIAYKYQE